jgi:hypothetical protein
VAVVVYFKNGQQAGIATGTVVQHEAFMTGERSTTGEDGIVVKALDHDGTEVVVGRFFQSEIVGYQMSRDR